MGAKLQSSIKNLGVHLDSKMSIDKQVSETCKASYFHIRALRHIRSSLTTETCKTVAAAIVGSRLVITEQPYNEGLIHKKYKQWEPYLWGVISK